MTVGGKVEINVSIILQHFVYHYPFKHFNIKTTRVQYSGKQCRRKELQHVCRLEMLTASKKEQIMPVYTDG